MTWACSCSSSTTRILVLFTLSAITGFAILDLRLAIESLPGQMQCEIGSFANLAGDTDSPAVFFGDAAGHGQAQAGAGFLCGIIGVGNAGENLGGGAGAGGD